ncbi:MAG: histidine kinase [Firmicutes bacterium]|nr:histidine kinase [Bacillota bacterium]
MDQKKQVKTNEEADPNLSNIRLADVIDTNLLQHFQDDFAKGVGVASITVDLEGKPVTKPSNYTRFCLDYTHSTACEDNRCAKSHMHGGQEAARLGKPIIYECHAGLIDFAAPIILEGQHIGTILGGQVLTNIPNEKKCRKIAKEIGVDETGYIEAVKEIRQLSKERVKAAANLLYIVANNMSKTEYYQQKLTAKSNLLSNSLDKISLAMQEVAASTKRVSYEQIATDKTNYNADTITSKMNEVIDSTKNIAAMIAMQQSEMARLDRLNLVGEMAASLGHEVRNPLTTVRGFLQLFHKKDEFKKYTSSLDIMIEELDRANEIITEFLSLAKDRKLDLKILDLNQIITKIIPLAQADGSLRSVQIKLELEEIPHLLLDEKEIRQLILNLVINAIEATDKDGIVTIKTFEKAGKTSLVISDKGCGICPKLLDKIGTPFLSTKAQGTGLGLAICYSIADRHSATLNISSAEGVGTDVAVIFNQSA